MPLPAYDKDEDTRSEWSKKEFPHNGECRWMPVGWGGKPTGRPVSTPDERRTIQRLQEQVIAFLRTAPVANPPIGVCPWIVSAGSDEEVEHGYSLRSSFSVANWPSKHLSLDKPGGRVVKGYALLHLNFLFNSVPAGWISPTYASPFRLADSQGEFFPEGQPAGLFQGFPAYFAGNTDENYLIIPRNNRPLFRPVRLDRVIRWQLAQFDKEIDQLRARVDNAKRDYDAYSAPTMQAGEERIIATRIERERAHTPAAQARIRANREAEVRNQMQALRAEWDLAAKPDHPFNIATRRKAEAEARLASLPAAQAQGPACLVARKQSYITPDIATAGESACSFNLVERNPGYYDRTLPRTAIQLVTISRFPWVPPAGGLPGSRHRAVYVNRHMVWGLDWQIFRRDVLGAREPFDVSAVAPYTGTPRPVR